MRSLMSIAVVCGVFSIFSVSAAEETTVKVTRESSANGRGTSKGTMEKEAGKASASSVNGEGKSIGGQAGSYFLNRWWDLMDVVDFSVGAGPGFLVNVHATKIGQIGGGYSDSYRVGMRGRSVGVWKEKRKEIGISLLYYQKVERERVTGWVETFRAEKMDLDTASVYANNHDRAFTGVGATVHALVLVDANVRPIQAVDFLLGWLTIDVLDDDTGKMKRNKDL